MIARDYAKNGQIIARHQGRLLASAVDPQDEAQQWVKRRQNWLGEVSSLVVLGAGCGYHIEALVQRTNASIVVIEYFPELVELSQSLPALVTSKVQFACLKNTKQLRHSESVRQAILKSFLVLKHAPSMASNPEFYRECDKQLVARDWGNLNWQWRLHGFADLDAEIKIGSDHPLTIHDLENTELVQNSNERERMLVKALRELVK